ncbi:MAG TPA: histidine phosphatase family protein, partial [Propionibacteriaceae bacterium]
MTAARIILWRHGRTDWNVVDRFQGQADISVDGVGYAQAVRAAEVLAAYRPT